MALINCPECGGKVSDKSTACIHCGFPLKFIQVKQETTDKLGELESYDFLESVYDLELLNSGDKRAEIVTALKSELDISSTDALKLVRNTPCYLFKNIEKDIAMPIIKRLDCLPVEYNLYSNGELKRHKPKEKVSVSETKAINSNAYIKKMRCPKCNKLIPEVSKVCPECGFTGISSYLLQLEKRKQHIVSDTGQSSNIDNKSKGIVCCPKCGSTAIEAVQRGYSFWTGFLGSGKTMNYCKNCGFKYDPKDYR